MKAGIKESTYGRNILRQKCHTQNQDDQHHAHNLLALLHDGCFKTPAAMGQTIERLSVFENVKTRVCWMTFGA